MLAVEYYKIIALAWSVSVQIDSLLIHTIDTSAAITNLGVSTANDDKIHEEKTELYRF